MILAADHTPAQDGHGGGQAIDLENLVAVMDQGRLEIHVRRPVGLRAGCDQEDPPLDLLLAIGAGDLDDVPTRESGVSVQIPYGVPAQVCSDPTRLRCGDRVLAPDQVWNRRPSIGQLDGDAVEVAAPVTRQVQRRLPQRLAGKSAGMDRSAARLWLPLDDADTFAEVGRLGCAFFSGGTRPDDDQIVGVRHDVASRAANAVRIRPCSARVSG